MPILSLSLVLIILVVAVFYLVTTPEHAICERCLHVIERSQIDKAQWFHTGNGRRACDPDDPCSRDVATPHPHVFT